VSRTQYSSFKQAQNELGKMFDDPNNVRFIHYSCESFYDRPDGSTPRVTSIAVRSLGSGQTRSFSIHQKAELDGLSVSDISANYDDLEREMLGAFYAYVRQHDSCTWVHWNMRDANYGFDAIAHQFRILGGDPVDIRDGSKLDLARLMHDFLGPRYVEHPRLHKLLERNDMVPRNFLVGEDEAKAFDEGNYVKLHQSTLSKVDAFMEICTAAFQGRLKSNNGYFRRRGLTISTVASFVQDHPVFIALSVLAVIFAVLLGIFDLLDLVAANS